MRNAVLDGVLDPTRTIQIGIRGSAEYLWEFSSESGRTVIHAGKISAMGISAIVEKARPVVADSPTYLSFDIDSLDPAFAPRHRTPEIGGLTSREALELLRTKWAELRRRRSRGGIAAIRQHDEYGTRWRSDAVRDPQPPCIQAGGSTSLSAIGLGHR